MPKAIGLEEIAGAKGKKAEKNRFFAGETTARGFPNPGRSHQFCAGAGDGQAAQT